MTARTPRAAAAAPEHAAPVRPRRTPGRATTTRGARGGGGLFLEWKMDLRDTMTQTIRERRGALAVTVASRQRAPMRSRNYLLHIDDAIVSHLSFNQPHVSLRDRAFLRSTALAHMTILPLEQRRP